MAKTFQLKLTTAVAIDGVINKAGSTVTVPEQVARDLLRRGRAVPDATEVAAPAEPVAAPEPEPSQPEGTADATEVAASEDEPTPAPRQRAGKAK